MAMGQFIVTTSIKKCLNLTARKRVVQGGTNAAKTYSIIPIIIDYATKHPRHLITVVAESIPAVRNGAVKIFQDTMFDTNRWIEDHWRSNPMEYKFSNGAIVQFTAFDSVGKAKAAGKRDVLFLNEANHIDYEIADALITRSNTIWIDYNPDRQFWVHDEILTEADSEFLLLTYKDNEAIPPEILSELNIKLGKAYNNPFGDRTDPKNIKSDYWHNWCRVYIDGEVGTLQGAIFQNWDIGEFDDSLPHVYGLDFGFSNDPDSLIKVAVDKKRRVIYASEVLYKTGNSTDQLIDILNNRLNPLKSVVVADSADPRTINDIRQRGLNIYPAKKGADSVRNGIKRIQDYEIIVDANSLNLINELRNYIWHDKRSQVPIDAYNHQIDPLRYAFDYLTQSALLISK
jgi:phage terminase large subunit